LEFGVAREALEGRAGESGELELGRLDPGRIRVTPPRLGRRGGRDHGQDCDDRNSPETHGHLPPEVKEE
jgi:hypothetical protein